MKFRDWLKKDNALQVLLWLGSGVFFLLMLVYSYQGWFTRYMADDYCNAVLFRDPFNGLYLRYIQGFGGNRYSNIWLVGISEFLGGIKSIPYLPVFHILLWVAGLLWGMNELKKQLKANWSNGMTAFLALSIAFFTLLQAPNLYQIVYWRSSMTTHFAPVVYGTLLAAYLLRKSNLAAKHDFAFVDYFIGFISAFVVGGFSEPTVAVMITLLALALFAVRRWGSEPTRRRMTHLLAWTLFGALLSLTVMAVSPANSRRLGDSPPSLTELIYDSFFYGLIFIQKTILELPLPSALTLLVPALLMSIYQPVELSKIQKQRLLWLAAAIMVISYILIVASFSPSVLGQGYPVERVRFYARLAMTLGLMIDGALMGVLFSKLLSRPVLQWALMAMLFATGVVYPLRAVVNAYNLLPEYRARAQAWDERDAFIWKLKAEGQTNLTVYQFDGVYRTKELDTYATHWVNQCAAEYYGLESIRAISPK